MCATYDPPREPGEDVNDSSGSCGAGFVHNTDANSLRCRWDGSHLGLPGFKPTFDYFPAPAGDGPSRTYMTCDQLATQHLYEVQSSGSVGSTYWDQDGKRWAQWVHNRDAIEQDLRRICSWAKTVNREGVEQYFGLNFRAQSLVEATHLASNEWHIVERIYNADGKLTKEWDARESASSSVGYTTYAYHELTPESELGWGSTWPSPWATRQNLLREEYVAAQPVWEYGETSPSERIYTRYVWEQLFNQIAYVESGKVVNGVDVPIRAESRLFDYQELEPLQNGFIDTNTSTHAQVKELVRQISSGKYWPDKMEGTTHYLDNSPIMVNDGTQIVSVPRLTGYYLQGASLRGQQLNGDGIIATSGYALGLPVVISRWDLTQVDPAASAEHTVISWTVNGQPALIRDAANVETKFHYHLPASTDWQGTSQAIPTAIGTGKTGLLAKIERDRTDEAWPAEFSPPQECPDLPGPYRFLGACASGKEDLYNALNLPAAVRTAIDQVVGGQKEVVEFRYSAEGHPFKIWHNGQIEERRHDADGRLVRITEGPRQTLFTYTPAGRVAAKTVSEGVNIVAHETFAYDRAGNRLGHCISRVGLACQGAFSGAFAPGDVSPTGTSRTIYTYDREDRLVQEGDPLGRVTTYTWDKLGRVVAEASRDCAGINCTGQERMIQRKFDLDGRLVELHHGNSQTVQTLGAGTETFEWDNFKRLKTHVDRRGNAWQMAWDKADRLRAKMIYGSAFPAPLDQGTEVVAWEYGPLGRVSAEIRDPEGFALRSDFERRPGGEVFKTTQTGFSPGYTSADARGRPLIRVDDTGLDVWTYSVNGLESSHSRVTLNDGVWDLSITEKQVVDRFGMPQVRVIEAGSESREWAFTRSPDAGLWRFDESDPAGRVKALIRDLAGFTMRTEETTPAGLDVSHFSVNARGEVLQTTDPSGGVTHQSFNAFGERTALQKPSPTNDDHHVYEWDAYGRLTAWDRQGERLEWVWDTDGTLEAEELVVGGVRTRLNEFGWDAVGRKTESNGLNPKVKQALGLQGTEARVNHHWGWDSAGRLDIEWVSASGADRGVMHTWSLTNGGTWQVASEHTNLQSVSFTQTTELDGAGRRTLDQTAFLFPSSTIEYAWSGQHPVGRVHNGSVELEHTLNDFGERLVSDGRISGQSSFHGEVVERDVLGRVRSHRQSSGVWAQDRWQGYGYDARHALGTSWEAWIGSGVSASVGSHSAATNASVSSVATGLGASSSVRQRGATIGSLEKITQGANDIWKAQRSAAGHRLTEIADQNTTWTIEHDALGRVTAAIDQSFEYDPLGRLVLARDTNDATCLEFDLTCDLI